MINKNHLKVFIDDLVVAFEEDRDIDMDVVLVQLQQFRDQVDALAARHSGTPHEGTEVYHQNLHEILEHFGEALEHLEEFMDELDIELLRQASEKAQTGDTKMRDFLDDAERNSDSIQAFG